MMGAYFSSKEKQNVLTIAAFKAFLDELIEKWEEIDRPQKQITHAKYSRTYAQNVLDKMFEGKDQEEVKNVIKQVKQKEVVIKNKLQAEREYRKMRKMENTIPMPKEDLLDIVELTILECTRCERTGQDIKECKHRKLFLKYDIQPLRLDPPEGKCAYQYKENLSTKSTELSTRKGD